MGFVRNTLHAHKCDLVMGTASGNELLQNTNPYYRTAFSLVYREDSGLAVASLDDPVLHTLEIGVVAGTPPSTVLAQNGLLARTHSYHLMADTRFEHPAENLVHDVEAGQIDVGIVWGPIAGYFAKQASVPLVVVPLSSEGSPVRLEYRITMGVRFNEPEWRRRINDLLRKKQAEINRILLDYGVPLMDERGQPITQ
jgi:quinoprotein dehydrogenase-associated probable ABC transporter substrate-binding protein